MKILVAVASKHGSTYEIAQAIANEINAAGFTADLQEVSQNPHLPSYDAAVIGSAIYMGRWLADALAYLKDNQEELLDMPVWLFSSGPLGNDLSEIETEEEPYNIDELIVQTRARDHQVFVGKLDTAELGLREKIVIRMVKAPVGDFRDWTAVREWAAKIIDALVPVAVPSIGLS
jgi:menaquinone-dependent protoporphyrinogen oxidase